MIRKTLTILSLLGLLLSAGAWTVQARKPVLLFSTSLPENLPQNRPAVLSELSESNWGMIHSEAMLSPLGECGFTAIYGTPRGKTQKVTRMIAGASLTGGALIARLGTETLITDDQNKNYLEFGRSYPANQMCRIPIWSVALTCAIACGLLTITPFLRRRRRKKLGLCLKCGYDLRASKVRCPECGLILE